MQLVLCSGLREEFGSQYNITIPRAPSLPPQVKNLIYLLRRKDKEPGYYTQFVLVGTKYIARVKWSSLPESKYNKS
jgi:hypothetical protein